MFAATVSFNESGTIDNVSYEQHVGTYIDNDRICLSRDKFREFLVLQGTGKFQPKQIQQITQLTPKQLQYILCNYDKLVDLFKLTIDTPDIKAESDTLIAEIDSYQKQQGGARS